MQLNESESDRKKSEEAVTHAENEKKELKREIDRLYNRPPKIEYRDKCFKCDRDEYKKAIEEMEDDKKAAKESREYFYRLVNGYNHEIDQRVEKIIGRKTFLKRFAEKLYHLVGIVDTLFFFAPFLYSIFITIIAIIRNDAVRNDFITAGKAIGKFFVTVFGGIQWLVLKAAGLSGFIENPTAEKIVWWVITVLLILIIIAAILVIGFLAYRYISHFIKNNDEVLLWLFDRTFLAVALADLGAISFLGDLIKTVISINLVLTLLIILVEFIFLRIFIPFIIEKIRGD
ncbi:MAG: hypothetical protein J1F60_10165 [Oscillospiraceae bacterium]|nr:hypothetical protein [Oscillospiraceae bacterium]